MLLGGERDLLTLLLCTSEMTSSWQHKGIRRVLPSWATQLMDLSSSIGVAQLYKRLSDGRMLKMAHGEHAEHMLLKEDEQAVEPGGPVHTIRRQSIVLQRSLVRTPGPETAGCFAMHPLWLWDECGDHIRAVLAVPQ